ncbi:MAG: hypothetical protein ACHQRM_00925 [Bacteroidia bacterium]
MSKKKIIFLGGSLNQTTQMHQISLHLSNEFDCYFSQIFANHFIIRTTQKLGLLDHTALAGQFKEKSDKYLKENNLKNDYRASVYNNTYDLVVACTDIILPGALKGIPTIWIQEGMIDGMNTLARITKALKLPRYLALGTSLNGSSNLCDIYCAASEGYKEHLTRMGTDRDKITVTGIPNFDNLHSHLNNDFPHKEYVMVATSDIRECLGKDNRPEFIQKAVKIANGRRLIFKLHPNEKRERAIKEIEDNAPADTLVFTEGNTNDMIANCTELITQFSTVVYVGIVLGKKVHSYFDVDELNRLVPLQNAGTSARNIASICRAFISYKGSGSQFLNQYVPANPIAFATAS